MRAILKKLLTLLLAVVMGLLLLFAWGRLEPQQAPAWLVGLVQRTAASGVTLRAPLHIAVAVDHPEADGSGSSIANGVTLYVEELNAEGGVAGRKLVVDVYDDTLAPERARQVAEEIATDSEAVAVVGHRVSATSAVAGEVYGRAEVPAITPTATTPGVTRDNPWYFRTVYTDDRLGRFIAHYVKTVIQPARAVVVRGEHAYGRTLDRVFTETATDLGIDVASSISIEPDVGAAVLRVLRQGKGRTAVFVAAYPNEAVSLIRAIREARLDDVVLVAPDSFDLPEFASLFQDFPLERRSPGLYADGIRVATPLLYDTADRQAGLFRQAYQRRFGEYPDWRAAFAYDAARAIAEALTRSEAAAMSSSLAEIRVAVRDELAAMNDVATGFAGVTGPVYFGPEGDSLRPAAIGRYQGSQLVSALTQLRTLRFLGYRKNPQKLIADGRMIYLDGQLMKHTNVVFTGALGDTVQNLNTESMTVDIVGTIWFQFRKSEHLGNQYDPSDIVFSNAVGPVELTNIEQKITSDGIVYKRSRYSGTFKLDFVPSLRRYQQPLFGIAFRHKHLSTTDLIYVIDLRGMGLAGEVTTGSHTVRLILESLGWRVRPSGVYQDVEWVRTQGDPLYADVPDVAVPHSTFVATIRLEPVGGIVHDLLLPLHSGRTFLIGGLVFLMTVVLGAFIERRALAFSLSLIQFLALAWMLWTGQRLLLEAGAEALPFQQLDVIEKLFEAVWWLAPAYYLVFLLNRFAWSALEERTRRAVPKMIKVLCAGIILLLALFGVIAFVYDLPVTSLLATSGLVGLIFGLAAQSNLSNVFSGIVLSIERPFAIGDVIEVEGHDIARVTDMTWRTTRMVTPASIEVSVPNNQVAERFLKNYSRSEAVKTVVDVHLPPALPIGWITEKIREGIGKSDRILREPAYGVEYAGVEIHQNQWAMNYQAYFFLDSSFERGAVCSEVLHHIWQTLADAGVTAKLGEPLLDASRPRDNSLSLNIPRDEADTGVRRQETGVAS